MSSSKSNSTSGSPIHLSRASSQTSLDALNDGAKIALRESSPVREIVFVGAGYVGGPTAAVIANRCPHINVTVVDKSEVRIRQWRSKHLPIHEPSLRDIVRPARDGTIGASARSPNLFFSTNCERHIAVADIIYLAVNTPTKINGVGAGEATDMSMFESAARSVAMAAKPGAIVVEKSTVPCRTAEMVREILAFHRPGVSFEILSNPEFLAEGTAIKDLLSPSRVLIGSSNTTSGLSAASQLADIYAHWVPRDSILTIDVWSSELAKLVANAMLAQRVSSINTISAICEKTGANIDNVAKAIGLDARLGSRFLQAGLGFGGSCFKKDILSLSYLANTLQLPEVSQYWQSVNEINQWQCRRYVESVIGKLNGSLRGKKVAVLGYAFKKDTADTRESQAAEVVRLLAEERPLVIAVYDPQCDKARVEAELSSLLSASTSAPILQPGGPVSVCDNPYDACAGTSAVLILTEWDQFRYPAIVQVRPKLHDIPVRYDSGYQSDSMHHELPTLDSLRSKHGLAMSCDTKARLVPEPECLARCRECNIGGSSGRHADEPIEWSTIAQLMHGEKYVFDARGVVDQVKMQHELGFRVESIGKVNSHARP